TEKLSGRKQECIHKLMNCGYETFDLRAILFFDDNQISSIFRIDIYTTNELIQLRNQLKEFVELITVQRMNENQYLNLLNIILPETASMNYDQKAIISGFDFSKGFPVFKTIDFLIENKLLLNKIEGIIFRNSTEFYRDGRLHNTAEIAAELSRTKIVIDNRRSDLFHKLNKVFSFLKCVDRSVFNLYDFNESNDFIFMDNKLVAEINNTEGTHFTARLIMKIFSIIYSDSYKLIGWNTLHHYYLEFEWNHCYLVSLRQDKKLDIFEFVKYIIRLLSSKVIKTYTFSLVDKLKSYTNTGDFPDKDMLDNIKFILLKEYDLILDKNYNTIIKKNTSQSIKKAVFESFNRNNRSMDKEQICEYMYIMYQYQKSEENERVLLKYLDKNPNLVSYLNVITGRKEWMEKIVS
ncbi:MAG: hypothetical protein ACYC25_13155, partial [Paludibacter sp.]